MCLSEFLQDEDVQWVAWSQIVIIGEAANRVSREEQAKHLDIPWRLAIAMRNRAIHGYDAIDREVVYETLITDIPNLIEVLEAYLPDSETG